MKNLFDQILDLLRFGTLLFIISNLSIFQCIYVPPTALGVVPSHSTPLKKVIG